jgi:myo-inositol-1(or 4)-monophosphatase
MMSLRGSRAVDAAAAQLIVREAGGHVAFVAYDDPLAAPLDLEPHSPVVAARTPESLAQLIPVVWPGDPTPEG